MGSIRAHITAALRVARTMYHRTTAPNVLDLAVGHSALDEKTARVEGCDVDVASVLADRKLLLGTAALWP